MAAAALTLVLAGCGGGGGGEAEEGSGTEEAGGCQTGEAPKVGVAFDVGGRGDLSFNDSAAAGVEKAADDLGAEIKEVEAGVGESASDREERLRLLADSGFNPIIAVGFIYSPEARTVASEYPDVCFAVVDGYSILDFSENPAGEPVPLDNLVDLTFAEEQGSFLVGAAAALKTKTDKVGFVGGVNGPLIQKFEAGYKAGVAEVDPKIEVLTEYLSQEDPQQGFENPSGGETAATGMYDNGADIVYHAAGKSGLGVFDAVQAAGKGNWAIGVDSDQYLTADPSQKKHILTSMLKRVDVAVFEYVEAFAGGEPPSGNVTYDLESNGVGYATSGGFVDDIAPKLDEYAEQIKSGEIEVPTAP